MTETAVSTRIWSLTIVAVRPGIFNIKFLFLTTAVIGCYRHLHICLHSLTLDVCSFSSHSLRLAIALFLHRFVRFIRGENEYTKGTSDIEVENDRSSKVGNSRLYE